MDIQLCNDNNEPTSTENTINNNGHSDSGVIVNCDEHVKAEEITGLEEFEQVLNEYTEQQLNSEDNALIAHSNSTTDSIITETLIEMGIGITDTANNANNCETKLLDVNSRDISPHDLEKYVANKNLSINNAQSNIDEEEILQCLKTEVVTLSLNDGIIDENDTNLDLDVLNNMFDSNNENNSIEIEIDIKNKITDENFINTSFFDADFAAVCPSGLNHTTLETNATEIHMCDTDNSLKNDMGDVIDLTESDAENITGLNYTNFEINATVIETCDNSIKNDMKNVIDMTESDTEDIEIAKIDTSEIHSDNHSECSFHSSDFELITEDEARMDGLIINFRQQNDINDQNAQCNENIIDMCLPGPSDDYAYRENHRIPEGDDFFNMFHGIFAPANIPDLIFLENKSVVPSQCMNVDIRNFGFDLAALNVEVFDQEYLDEANETAKKIRNSYHENDERKLRRRPL